MRPAYIRKEPYMYYLIRQIMHDKGTREGVAIVAIIGSILLYRLIT